VPTDSRGGASAENALKGGYLTVNAVALALKLCQGTSERLFD
jgi:hypothetical protein